jgi:regulator of sigma E protease
MGVSILYALFAIIGLGFLIFIHELGHYIVARRQGMKVEAFSIGFGKPIYVWERDGVRWQLCMLPFGGYVRIAGMQKEGSREPYEIHDGFYGKRPWQRIQVALAGPLVNIAFALLAFTALWVLGGRVKPFADFTQRIGWIDPHSALYEKGVRPGDQITEYAGRPFQGFRDLLIASVMKDDSAGIQGYKIDYFTGKKTAYDYRLQTYDDPRSYRDPIRTIGVLSPARYLIYQGHLPEGSPMATSGIQARDRILWADGDLVFSSQQLSTLVNESTALLTVQRGDAIFLTKVPRVHIDELSLSAGEKGEIDDWRHEAGLKGRLQDLAFIPYNFSFDCRITERIDFIDESDQERAFETCQRCAYFNPLNEGDQILAVNGVPVANSYELFHELQTRRSLLIVQRDPSLSQPISWRQADASFETFNPADLQAIAASIGTVKPVVSSGNLHMLNPVVPKPLLEFDLTPEQRATVGQELAQTRKEIEAIKDPAKREAALQFLESSHRRLMLGLPMQDREVVYNPNPAELFVQVVRDTGRTLVGLFSGSLSPKYVSGPVGIVHVVQQSWMMGAKEALFWMGVISLNLGLVNLLPIPVLDGGHICFSILEMFTKRPIKAKTMERLILPFIGLLIVFFLFVTYQDVARLFGKLF